MKKRNKKLFPIEICAVVGLAGEARLLSNHSCRVLVSGGTAEAAERAVREGAAGLLSFGLAGGLDPGLPAGALVVPRFVRVDGRSFEANPAMVAALGGATQQVLLGGTAIVGTAAAKRALWRQTGAAAVDLESGAVAEVAGRHDLPFAVLRAVCDPADRNLPPASLVPLRPGGRIPVLGILASVIAHPGQLPALLALGRDAAAARRALVAALAGVTWNSTAALQIQ